MQFRVGAIPTIILCEKKCLFEVTLLIKLKFLSFLGKVVDRFVGLIDDDKLSAFIAKLKE